MLSSSGCTFRTHQALELPDRLGYPPQSDLQALELGAAGGGPACQPVGQRPGHVLAQERLLPQPGLLALGIDHLLAKDLHELMGYGGSEWNEDKIAPAD